MYIKRMLRRGLLAICIGLAALHLAAEVSSVSAQQPDLSLTKAQAEIAKLNEEVRALKAQNADRETPLGRMAAIAGIVGGVLGSFVTMIAAFLGIILPRRFEAARAEKMRQDKELTREQHNLELFRDLSSPNPRLQLAAAAVLLQRLYAKPKNVLSHPGTYDAIECKTIVDVLVAVIKEKDANTDIHHRSSASPELIKYVADNIVKALHAVLMPAERASGQSPLAITDWQGAQLVNVWWERVDARGIDFFQANLSRAGLARSALSKATFYEASLASAILRHADLREVNLQSADLTRANLIGADLTGANLQGTKLDGVRFDASTKWPEGFDPTVISQLSAA